MIYVQCKGIKNFDEVAGAFLQECERNLGCHKEKIALGKKEDGFIIAGTESVMNHSALFFSYEQLPIFLEGLSNGLREIEKKYPSISIEGYMYLHYEDTYDPNVDNMKEQYYFESKSGEKDVVIDNAVEIDMLSGYKAFPRYKCWIVEEPLFYKKAGDFVKDLSEMKTAIEDDEITEIEDLQELFFNFGFGDKEGRDFLKKCLNKLKKEVDDGDVSLRKKQMESYLWSEKLLKITDQLQDYYQEFEEE